jgi:hypothetical protein
MRSDPPRELPQVPLDAVECPSGEVPRPCPDSAGVPVGELRRALGRLLDGTSAVSAAGWRIAEGLPAGGLECCQALDELAERLERVQADADTAKRICWMLWELGSDAAQRQREAMPDGT